MHTQVKANLCLRRAGLRNSGLLPTHFGVQTGHGVPVSRQKSLKCKEWKIPDSICLNQNQFCAPFFTFFLFFSLAARLVSCFMRRTLQGMFMVAYARKPTRRLSSSEQSVPFCSNNSLCQLESSQILLFNAAIKNQSTGCTAQSILLMQHKLLDCSTWHI